MALNFQGQPKNLQELRQLHEQQNAQMESRRNDLRLAQLLSRALDPAIPKGFRQFGLRQVAKAAGLDPDGKDAKGMIGLLAGLDPQSLEGLRRSISDEAPDAGPGQVQELVRGIISGSMPAEDLLAKAKESLQPPPMKMGGEEGEEQQVAMGQVQGSKGGKPFTHAPYGIGDAGFGYQGVPTEEPEEPLPPPGTPGGGPMMFPQQPGGQTKSPLPEPMKLGGPTEEEEIAARDQMLGWTPSEEPGPMGIPQPKEEVEVTELPAPSPKDIPPEEMEVEGEIPGLLNLTPGTYSLSDIRKAGYRKMPTDPKDRKKLIEHIDTMQSGALNSTAMINQVAALVRGRPEALDAFSVRLPYVGEWGVNVPNLWENTVEFFKGLTNIEDRVNPHDPKLMEAAGKVADKVSQMSYLERWTKEASETAEVRARINSIMVPLAYAMARASHGTGVLSNQDVLVQLERLGKSASPDSFLAALKETSDNIHSQYMQDTKARTGKEVPIAHLATKEMEAAMDMGGLTPKNFWGREETKGPGRFSVPRLADVATKEQEASRTGGQAIEQRRTREAELARREQLWKEEQKGMVRQQHTWAKEGAERAERGEQRAIEREQREIADKRATRIQEAFVQLGRAFRIQTPNVGGGPPAVPAQQAGAFQVGAIQRRTPPTIPDTIRRRTQGGR